MEKDYIGWMKCNLNTQIKLVLIIMKADLHLQEKEYDYKEIDFSNKKLKKMNINKKLIDLE